MSSEKMHAPSCPPRISQETLAEFDRRFARIDDGKEVRLDNPAGALRECMGELTTLLQKTDLSSLTLRPSWWNRFSGAYLLSQVELDAQVKLVDRLFENCRGLSRAAADRAAELRDKKNVLAGALSALPELDAWAGSVIAGSDGTEDSWLRTRFENKRAQLKVTIVSAGLIISQIDMAIKSVEFLLDVHFELENRLYPVWKQYVESTAANSTVAGKSVGKPEEIELLARQFDNSIRSSAVGVN